MTSSRNPLVSVLFKERRPSCCIVFSTSLTRLSTSSVKCSTFSTICVIILVFRFTELMRLYGPRGCSVVSLPSSMLHPNFTNAAGHQFGIVFSESSLNPILCCTGLQACSCRSTSLITGKPVDLSAHGTLAVLLTQNDIDWNPFK